MKKEIISLLSLLMIVGCGSKSKENDAVQPIPVTDVSVSNVSYGNIDKTVELTAVTVYLKKNVVSAANSAYITASYVQPGTIVRRGQTLYVLTTKEREALGRTIMGNSAGIVHVKAPTAGIVTDVLQQSGGYVTEGAPLCSVANIGSLVFEIEVPAEQMKYAKAGRRCVIQLPDGRRVNALLSTPLATMDIASQTQQVPAKASIGFLPEGLKCKAILNTSHTRRNMQILPKEAVQSDENMTSFWVLKIVRGNRVSKIIVETGNSNTREVEILSPKFNPDDEIVTAGSYQLQDGDKVKIIK